MCHDVGSQLTAGALLYRDEAIGPLRRENSCMKSRGTKRAQKAMKDASVGDVNTKRWKAQESGCS